MAKSKKKKKPAGKKHVKAAVVERKTVQAKKFPLKTVIIIFAVLAAVQMVYFTLKAVKQSKKPGLVTSWNYSTGGVTSMAEYGGHLYVLNSQSGLVYKYAKMDGTLLSKFKVNDWIGGAAETSAGETFILTRNNRILKYDSEGKPAGEAIIPVEAGLSWLALDSKDNIIAANYNKGKIYKLSPSMEKIFEAGGKGVGREMFDNIGRIYAGPGDSVYCVNWIYTGSSAKKKKMEVKIFSAKGKFIRSWLVKGIKKYSPLEDIAVGSSGNVYINCHFGSYVMVYNSKGRVLGSFDRDKNKMFYTAVPSAIAGGKEGLIFIATSKIGVFKEIKY